MTANQSRIFGKGVIIDIEDETQPQMQVCCLSLEKSLLSKYPLD
ncbi:138_t:CDS:2 [Funneliformis geosporum]|uniref:138_t:CDS:1 n=1 Tax=Funneliformis geosporum TaxID=1117311 RepID=A0A9W4SET3_9GLOM|nr:138_t:CDS:2 [Funneliformis geosporum]